jgi:hypothetical protein
MGQYTQRISGDVADIVLFDLQLEEWLAAGMVAHNNPAYVAYKESRS